MNDNQLIALISSILRAGFASVGLPVDTALAAAYQPTLQGVNTVPTVYLFKVMDNRLGFTHRQDGWVSEPQATFTGAIAGNVLTASSIIDGALAVGQMVSGDGIDAGLYISGLGTGTGGAGTYTVNQTLTVPVEAQDMITIPGMVHAENQQYETTFQVSALVAQNPANVGLTASDYVNKVAAILSSSAAIVSFEAEAVGILRIGNVQNPWFLDDRERNEASPSFTFVLTHKQSIISYSPVVEEVDYQILRV